MNLYYIIIAIIVILLIFPTLRTSVFNVILPINNSKSSKVEKFEGKNKKVVFTAYTADWCPHCVDFKKNIYGKLKAAFNGHPYISIRNVDCTDDKEGKIKTEGGNQIEGYPTLVTNIYANGNMVKELNVEGNRGDVNEIVNYLKSL